MILWSLPRLTRLPRLLKICDTRVRGGNWLKKRVLWFCSTRWGSLEMDHCKFMTIQCRCISMDPSLDILHSDPMTQDAMQNCVAFSAGQVSVGFVEEGSVSTSRAISYNLTVGQSIVIPTGTHRFPSLSECHWAFFALAWLVTPPESNICRQDWITLVDSATGGHSKSKFLQGCLCGSITSIVSVHVIWIPGPIQIQEYFHWCLPFWRCL